MTAPPAFTSIQHYVSRIGDVEFWSAHVSKTLDRHNLLGAGRQVVAGHNPTYPTFLYGDVVVKLFGHLPAWRTSHAAESAAQRLIANDPEIAAPRLLGAGELFADVEAPWPYLITTRMRGVASWRTELSVGERTALAADVGAQVRRVHALRPTRGVATDKVWSAGNVAAAAAQSSLPSHLVGQVDDFLAGLEPFDCVFVHGDLISSHVFVDDRPALRDHPALPRPVQLR